MPFGRKPDPTGRVIDFDSVYRRIFVPSVEKAGLEPVRADEEKIGGTIHKPMFERLLICPYPVADITGANPNVFYKLCVLNQATQYRYHFCREDGAAVRRRPRARDRVPDRRIGRSGRR